MQRKINIVRRSVVLHKKRILQFHWLNNENRDVCRREKSEGSKKKKLRNSLHEKYLKRRERIERNSCAA